MLYAVVRTPWHQGTALTVAPTTYGIGNAFLGDYVLPFEVASLVLLAALIGAIVISRQSQGVGEPENRDGRGNHAGPLPGP